MQGGLSFTDDEIVILADRIVATAATIDSAIHRLLTDIRRFDSQEGWAHDGALSCAHWLSWKCGIELGVGREKVRVAHALANLPLIAEALRLGQLSYSKVRALTRVVKPDDEKNLVEIGKQCPAAALERICRVYAQQQPRPPGTEEPPRWLRTRDTLDGMVRIQMQLRPEEAARLLEAIDVCAEQRVDGIVALAEHRLRGDKADTPPIEVMVHIDAATLTGHANEAGLAPQAAERLLCDAGVVPVLDNEAGTPLNVGRKTRVISAALRRALLARDGRCRFPGCTNRKYIDAHHLVHWSRGGETSLKNLVLVCSAHHTLLHEGGFKAHGDGDLVQFYRPNGDLIPEAGIPPVPEPLDSIAIDADAWEDAFDVGVVAAPPS